MLQQQVRSQLAFGMPGSISRAYHSYYLTGNGFVGDNNVCVGCFVKAKDTPGVVYGASGMQFTPGTDTLLGICVRDRLINSCNGAAVTTYNVGDPCLYLVKGVILIEVETTATVGQYVFLKNADGSIVFNATNVLADHTYTGFVVSVGGTTANNNPIIIEVTSEN